VVFKTVSALLQSISLYAEISRVSDLPIVPTRACIFVVTYSKGQVLQCYGNKWRITDFTDSTYFDLYQSRSSLAGRMLSAASISSFAARMRSVIDNALLT
jgi:hypothetical protein